MTTRKGWDLLSPTYRKRLEKAGITKSEYDGGASLKKGRGHERTPEHPIARVNKSKYPEYYSARERLIAQLQAKKDEFWRDRPRWSEERSITHIRKKPVGNSLLRAALEMTEEEMVNAIREDSDTFYFLGYH